MQGYGGRGVQIAYKGKNRPLQKSYCILGIKYRQEKKGAKCPLFFIARKDFVFSKFVL